MSHLAETYERDAAVTINAISPLDTGDIALPPISPYWLELGYDLCEHCRSITSLHLCGWDPPDTQGLAELSPAQSLESATSAAWYGPKLTDVTNNRGSCRLCRVVYEVLHDSGQLFGDDSRRPVLRLLTSNGSVCSNGGYDTEEVNDLADDIPQRFVALWLGIDVETTPYSYEIPKLAKNALRLYGRSHGQGAHGLCPGEPPAADILDRAPDLIRQWAHDCIYERDVEGVTLHVQLGHASCEDRIGDGRRSILPNRLILIPRGSEEGWPRLVEPYLQYPVEELSNVRYVALSYCWGKKTVLKLTRSIFHAFKVGLPMHQLPQTLKDAIEMCRLCGYWHIWIDALCIVQDDEADWEREARLMAKVYQHAAMTFVVLGKRDSHTGLFNRTPSARQVGLPWFEPDGNGWHQNGYVVASMCLPLERNDQGVLRSGLEQEIRKSDWFSRAWTFQEDLLSRRVVYFGEHQIYWQCRSLSRSEDGIDDRLYRGTGWSPERSLFYVAVMNERPEYGQRLLGKALNVRAQGGVSNHELLLNYTSRSLTNPGDKLIAFEGLAQLIAHRSGQKFIAGVWDSKVALSLWWHSADGRMRRVDPIRAPSWSWASVEGLLHGDNPKIGQLNNTEDGYAIPWALGGGLGALRKATFVNANFSMVAARGIQPVSLEVTALTLLATRSAAPCVGYPRTMQQLRDDIVIWPEQYHAWPADKCHLLFTNLEKGEDVARMRSKQSLRCSVCKADLQPYTEKSSIEHGESCPYGTERPTLTSESRVHNLLGVAYFDDPADPVETFEAILLWKQVDPNVYKSNKVRQSNILDPAEVRNMERMTKLNRPNTITGWTSHSIRESFKPYTRQVVPSEENILGCQGYYSKDDTIRMYWPLKVKRCYFMLLVERLASRDSYRRVGVAIGYHIHGLGRFGGVDFGKVAKPKTMLLV